MARSQRALLKRIARTAVTKCLSLAPCRNPVLPAAGPAGDGVGKGGGYEVSVMVVTDAEIAELNRDFRWRDRPTDVLSFAQQEGEWMAHGGEPEEPVTLGDIVISLETARRQALQQHHPLFHEIAFLVVHGTLHLWGYDHVLAADRRVMWQWQDTITPLCLPRWPAEPVAG